MQWLILTFKLGYSKNPRGCYVLLSMQFLGLGQGKKWKILLGTGFGWLVWMNLKSVFAFGLLFGHRSLYNLGLIQLSLFSN